MPTSEVTRFAVYPTGWELADFSNKWDFLLQIEERHTPDNYDRTWAITRQGGLVWTRDGKWEIEPLPSSRTKRWLKRARWSHREIMAEAYRIVDTLEVGYMNFHQFAAWAAQKQAEKETV